MAKIFIGLSGYSYKAWQGPMRFYPPGLKATGFLSYYATRYQTVELDGVWYRLPTDQAVESWNHQTPAGFLYAPKAHRQITHVRRLKPEGLSTLNAMLERFAPLREAGKLGPILLQLPPNLKRDDTRHAGPVEELLRQYGIAWAAVDTDEHEAEHRDTAGFRYARLRKSRYSLTELQQWGERLGEAAARGQDCFVYCKHEDEGSPWLWADELLKQTE